MSPSCPATPIARHDSGRPSRGHGLKSDGCKRNYVRFNILHALAGSGILRPMLSACASLAAREGMRQRMRNDVSLACKSTQKQTVSHEPMRFHESGQLSMCRVKSLVHPVKLLASFVDAFGKIIVNRNLCIGGPISAVRLDEMRKIRIFHNDVSVKNEFQKR